MFLALLSLMLSVPLSSAGDDPRIPIAVIDTGIKPGVMNKYLCQTGHKDLTGYGLEDAEGHGTNIAGIISKTMDPSRQCLVIIKWYHTESAQKLYSYSQKYDIIVNAMKAAVESGARFINMSLSGNDLNLEESQLIRTALASGTVFTVAAGNEGQDLTAECNAYPACYFVTHKNYHVVANYVSNMRVRTSNYGGPVTDCANGQDVEGNGIKMSGTSQATAVVMSRLIELQ